VTTPLCIALRNARDALNTALQLLRAAHELDPTGYCELPEDIERAETSSQGLSRLIEEADVPRDWQLTLWNPDESRGDVWKISGATLEQAVLRAKHYYGSDFKLDSATTLDPLDLIMPTRQATEELP
jgi:hypothetical protein